MNHLLSCFIVVSCFNFGFAQTPPDLKKAPKKHVFLQADFSVPLQANTLRNDNSYYEDEDDSWFIPNGINAVFGIGVHHNQWIALSANTGICSLISNKLVTVPVFANFKLMPRIGDDFCFGADVGLGQSFALGRGRLSGTFQRYKIFVGNNELQVFLEAQVHGYFVHDEEMGSICLGLSITNFL